METQLLHSASDDNQQNQTLATASRATPQPSPFRQVPSQAAQPERQTFSEISRSTNDRWQNSSQIVVAEKRSLTPLANALIKLSATPIALSCGDDPPVTSR